MNDSNMLYFWIMIAVIAGAFAAAITAMILKARTREQLHRERMLLAEKGLEIPKELYPQPRQPEEAESTRRALRIIGTVFLFAGLAPVIAIAIASGFPEAINGSGLLFIGIGMLVAAQLIKPKRA